MQCIRDLPPHKKQCKAVGVCASAYTLAVIAVERYYAICRPLQSRKWRTKKRALFTISLVWVFSFVCNTGSLFIFDSVPYRTQWTCDTTKGPLIDFLYQLYITLFSSDFLDGPQNLWAPPTSVSRQRNFGALHL
ncbi:hypothetical protein ANCDUO_12628 [Ancylostoma duodenale]|uniref:G-protein coupled receptors family 1 profile domain-containing protein n=1 Tax=Ancylostoma duodenale TaxID=51022 RepID=A0A0C2D4Y7_9BILA|nr:hypothetical protein ANCDUO_12628 [Ancylostoma duodenale]